MQSYRPVILLGNGMRGEPQSINYLRSLNIPILTTWMGADLLAEDDPTYCGRPGIFGQRAANIIQQKATHLYCYGARLDGEQVAYDYDRFAPNAEIYVYDIDPAEYQKFPPRYKRLEAGPIPAHHDWLNWCKALYHRFRPELDGVDAGKFVDPFYLIALLHDYSEQNDVFAIGSSGNAPCVFLQAYRVKQGQRISNVSTIGSMGADIPMALGAALANPGRRVICVTGDGGFQMNTQELETIRRLHLPVTFFVLNNNGYNSIRVAQKARFGRVTGADPKSGLTLPRLEDIAAGYHMAYMSLYGADLPNFHRCFDYAPLIVEVMVNPDWEQLPRVMASGTPLRTDDMQDMMPKIDDLEELMKC